MKLPRSLRSHRQFHSYSTRIFLLLKFFLTNNVNFIFLWVIYECKGTALPNNRFVRYAHFMIILQWSSLQATEMPMDIFHQLSKIYYVVDLYMTIIFSIMYMNIKTERTECKMIILQKDTLPIILFLYRDTTFYR